MKIAITGGTGFVGKYVTSDLEKRGHTIYVLTRSPYKYKNTEKVTYIEWLTKDSQPENILPPVDAIINLAGDSLFGYWTKSKKDRIVNSRLTVTDYIINLIKRMEQPPEVLINATAVGFYGTSKEDTFTESTTHSGDDFLAHVTKQWEQKAREAEAFGVRTVLMRFGIILGKEGSLPLMTLPFRFFIGGKVGSGDQWMSWIHISDVVGLLNHLLNNQQISGALNATAPNPVTNKVFSQTMAKILHRPYWLPAPRFALKLVLGEMSILVLEGQKVIPTKAIEANYTFQFPQLQSALRDIYGLSKNV